MAKAWIGLSGYSYKPWQGEGRFYPPELKQTQFLEFYRDRYDAVEMDGSWYRVPSEKAVEDWNAKTPESFKFSFKLHRKITHIGRLKLDQIDLLKFMLKRLGPLAKTDKLGPFLIQLPPTMKRNDTRAKEFFENLPVQIEGCDSLPSKLQWAIEFRSDTWHDPAIEQLLRDFNIAWVAADTDENDAQRRDTADFVYARLRKSDYTPEMLRDWSNYLAQSGKPSYVYCKHEDEESPWVWADQILENLKIESLSQL